MRPGRLRAAASAADRAAAALLARAVRAYQAGLSPLLGRHCRFEPTCSQYALEALARHGAAKGSALAMWRVLRCHPFGGHGYDPVPPRRGAP